MKILNLVYPEQSEVKFELRQYPDGQQDIIIDPNIISVVKPEVQIRTRFNSFKDLELIICATKALRNLKIKEIHLYIPYILGGRSDRKFQDGGTSYMRDIISPIINQQEYESVTVLDPHSDIIEGVIKNIETMSNVGFVKYAVTNIGSDDFILVSPDAGALKKIYNVAEKIGAENITIGAKHREISTGKILSTEVHVADSDLVRDVFIIDDICDGGRTFIELSKTLRREGSTGNHYLIVTHGIFSAGYEELSKHFTKIYTTNSIKDIQSDFIQQLNIF
jgi:ribose-phosphate pyrophosphokinase